MIKIGDNLVKDNHVFNVHEVRDLTIIVTDSDSWKAVWSRHLTEKEIEAGMIVRHPQADEVDEMLKEAERRINAVHEFTKEHHHVGY